LEFVTIAGASDKLILEEELEDFIIILPNITQHGRIRIGSEIFGVNIAPRYRKNSYILAKFIQDNEMIDTFPDEVQFYFTHTIDLSTGLKTYQLAFVKWYQSARSEEHTSELQSQSNLVCRLLLEKKKKKK